MVAAQASVDVYLTGAPDYEWHDGCFGTATGNLIGYWDRHGFPNFYTGPTANGVAPLNSFGPNYGIRALWASRAGLDGRPANKPGHEDDYWDAYESTAPDPYVTAGRKEHAADCIGDFIGLNQLKWKNLDGECDGNVDGWVFAYWDKTGNRRLNFTPGPQAGLPAVDLQSGLRAWAEYRGYRADVFTQLVEFNPECPLGKGFTFAALQAEIDAGYPVLLFMQEYGKKSRPLGNMPRANPSIHGMLAYGYYITDSGAAYVRCRTSWATGDTDFRVWANENWMYDPAMDLRLRGVIGFHPLPSITGVKQAGGQITLQWDGPAAELYSSEAGANIQAHWYVVEQATSLTRRDFVPVNQPSPKHELTLPAPTSGAAFYRVKLVPPG
jgi:hypothetical protein